MIEKTCINCVKWFKCGLRAKKWDNNIRKYVGCDDFECDDRLDGREAMCAYCGSREPSAPILAFFQYQPDREYDSYYCGCYGWD